MSARIFLIIICVYGGMYAYSQEEATYPGSYKDVAELQGKEDATSSDLFSVEEEEVPEKSYIAPIMVTIGLGLVLEIAGLLTHIEANRRFVQASETYAKLQDDSDNSKLKSNYDDEQSEYLTYRYASWGLFGSGAISIGFGAFFVIKQLMTINKNINKEHSTKKNVSYTHIPIVYGKKSDVFVFIEPSGVGIGVQ